MNINKNCDMLSQNYLTQQLFRLFKFFSWCSEIPTKYSLFHVISHIFNCLFKLCIKYFTNLSILYKFVQTLEIPYSSKHNKHVEKRAIRNQIIVQNNYEK